MSTEKQAEWVASSGSERPDGCIFKTFAGLCSGLMAGGIAGGLHANFMDSAISPVRSAWAVPKAMGAMAGTFAFVGGAFAATECFMESARGKKDFWNSVAGGFAAGAVTGAKAGRMGIAVGAGAAYALAAAGVDIAGGSAVGKVGIVNDGECMPRKHTFPYLPVEAVGESLRDLDGSKGAH
mmetsp:Transcript_24248/g.29404  ORF Transcript_24248/g.29404 Transcript_24248/m.29404 type:complete len:181 (+) Transcript_24248:163-705(+)|eukprot:CAMPEP_0197848396 /NCGR_PEP_ID=MMETSP1438-20131217/8611_1 /TAXON_ID=1461541 /ORGANISM="Pterosperma sp., Strain CCMP1384" /LENGTH=180 /DNA_ID=CAMNT_0043460617 /DNA_START=155 /DNA_END=697 /DNA_ORIENTATION=+